MEVNKIAKAQDEVISLTHRALSIFERKTVADRALKDLALELRAANDRLRLLEVDAAHQASLVKALYESTSWKVSAPLRGASILRRKGRTLTRLIQQRDWARIKAISLGEGLASEKAVQAQVASTKNVHVVCTAHTDFVGSLIASSLRRYGFDVNVSNQMPETFDAELYIVVCAQMYERLPPAHKRICVQMEQSTSSRWFTGAYLDTLRESLAVFDYSQVNLKYLDGFGIAYPRVFYVPIKAMPSPRSFVGGNADFSAGREKRTEVLFYGDDKNERRSVILDEVRKRFDLKVINNLFGDELYQEIRQAKVVLNIHYYDRSLLETTRIYECLSLRANVVSEVGIDQSEHSDPHLSTKRR